MNVLFRWLVRAVLLAAGLVFALSLTVAFVGLVLGWAVRSSWARLTGRPLRPFVMRMDPRRGFEQAMRRAQAAEASRTPRADSVVRGRGVGDVIDVQPK